MSGAPTVLFWDLDGTLLTTARAGIFAFEAAVRDVLGEDLELSELRTAGLTDAQIAAQVIESTGREADAELVDRLLRAYESHLPAALPRRTGRVIEGVEAVLRDLEGRDDVINLLLTGNTRAGAAAKLSHYGLDALIADGAFCTGLGERAEIARAAVEIARERHGDGVEPRLFVIGDTPHDVACGKAVGALTIAVATGPVGAEELAASEPWALLERIPEPAELRALIGIDPRGSGPGDED